MNHDRAAKPGIDLTDCTDEQIIEFVDCLNAQGRAIALNIPATREGVVYFFSKIFRCRHCGKCCDGSLEDTEQCGVDIEASELDDILSYLKTDRAGMEGWLDHNNGTTSLAYPCAFLSPENRRCDIYTVRPLVCRYFPMERPATIGTGADTHQVLTVDADCPSARDAAIRCLMEIRDSSQ